MDLSTAPTAVTASLATTPRVGRPPRVNAQAIIEAALEIGLERVTLKQIADRLGVAPATLYRHVRNRDELVRLAAFRLALTRQLPENAGGHWSELAVRYAESLFESFTHEPQLISELMRGRLGPDLEIDFLEHFLSVVCKHGFTPNEGVHLYRSVALVTIGAAVGATAVRASEAAGVPQDVAVKRALAERDDGKLPHVRSALNDYLDLDPKQWLNAVHALLCGIAEARGERLPASLAVHCGVLHNQAGAPASIR